MNIPKSKSKKNFFNEINGALMGPYTNLAKLIIKKKIQRLFSVNLWGNFINFYTLGHNYSYTIHNNFFSCICSLKFVVYDTRIRYIFLLNFAVSVCSNTLYLFAQFRGIYLLNFAGCTILFSQLSFITFSQFCGTYGRWRTKFDWTKYLPIEIICRGVHGLVWIDFWLKSQSNQLSWFLTF